jgi:hypothetical protein
MSKLTSGMPEPLTANGLVLSVRKRDARFWISGCENWLPTLLSTIDLGSVGFLKAAAEEAQSNPLKRLRSFILVKTGRRSCSQMT